MTLETTPTEFVEAARTRNGAPNKSDLLDRVIEAHGGLECWRGVRSIDALFNFYGGLLDLKGFPGHRRPVMSADTSQPRVVMQRLSGDPDDRWIFTADRVWIERRDGEVIEDRSHPRRGLCGPLGWRILSNGRWAGRTSYYRAAA